MAKLKRPKTTGAARTAAPQSRGAPEVGAVIRRLERESSAKFRADLGPRYGIVAKTAFGAPMAKIKAIAKGVGRNHALAAALWRTGVYDARLLASMVDEPEKVTVAQMDRWAKDFDNWSVCDTLCFTLFDRTPHALGRVDAWAPRTEEFVRRAAFALLASVALHRKDIADKDFAARLQLIERAARDDRNFVKKGVSWALRSIGGRRTALHGRCVALAERLSQSDDAAARWVGRDSLRDLLRPAVRKRAAT
ncbi:MAG: DNA alkylation repair protein [Alphaproteobacteria bacterium]|nr:DNA alkylation repair protein [Alphaproteobacteria bacterium]